MAIAMAVGRFRASLIPALLLTLVLLPAPCRSVDGRIKNFVILVMENRSFDHMLGWMKRLNPKIDGVTGKESNPMSVADLNSSRIFFDDEADYVDPDPGHLFEEVREQVFGSNDTSVDPPPMNGFVQQAASMTPNMSELVMKGFKPEAVPIYRALVQEFAVFDRWFSALPGPTQPNRLFVYSATSYGATDHDKSQLASGYPQKTIFQSLEESGLSFGIYHHGLPATLFYRELRKVKYVSNFHKFNDHFQQDARNGSLPNVAVIETRYFQSLSSPANDDHPSHDISTGQKFVKRVYEILRGIPQWTWAPKCVKNRSCHISIRCVLPLGAALHKI